ncbi:MAG: acyl-CoA dehydrogenase family protein [Deltaproteobacteria bacterium]|nr:acyl-CoA dehydrogenase family protein [Deltaproteobacteria bacterium]
MSDNYMLTDEQKMVKKTVRRMAQEKIAPIAAVIDETGEFSQDIHTQFKKLGLFGLSFPETYGGSDMGIISAALVLEEIGRVCSSSAIICASPIAVGRIILEYGKDEQKDRYLPQIASGENTGAIALSEPEAESDIDRITTRAEKRGEQYVITGRKSFVDRADVAGFITVFAGNDNSRESISVSVFIVEKDTPGWSIDHTVEKMGTQAIHACELIFDGCSIPKKNILGQEGEGDVIAAKVLGLNCVVTAARALGIAQGALDYALNYTQERIQFGRPVASFQGIQFMLADMATQIEAGRYLLYKACAEIDRGEEEGYYSGSMAKCFLSDTAMKVTTDAVQLLGGYGYMKDHPVERMMRDAKLTQLEEGTNRSQRLALASEMLRKK